MKVNDYFAVVTKWSNMDHLDCFYDELKKDFWAHFVWK